MKVINHYLDSTAQSFNSLGKIEVVDEENGHKFVFTQTKDNGVSLEIKPYDG